MTRSLRRHGFDLSYETKGEGPTVLCIQGVGVIGRGWSPQVDRLSSRFRTMTFDNRGLGASVPCPQLISIEAMADDALAIADAEGVDRFHLVGHSMGGLIAQHIALTAPRRVKTLSLLCTFARGKDATAPSLRMMFLGLRARIGTRAMRRSGMLQMIMPRAYLRTVDRRQLARDLELLFGRDLADQPSIVMTQLKAMGRYDATPRLGELAGVPTLVVSGAHDPIAPPALGRRLAENIPGARFVPFPHASHALPIQCADELHTLLLDHFRAAN